MRWPLGFLLLAGAWALSAITSDLVEKLLVVQINLGSVMEVPPLPPRRKASAANLTEDAPPRAKTAKAAATDEAGPPPKAKSQAKAKAKATPVVVEVDVAPPPKSKAKAKATPVVVSEASAPPPKSNAGATVTASVVAEAGLPPTSKATWKARAKTNPTEVVQTPPEAAPSKPTSAADTPLDEKRKEVPRVKRGKGRRETPTMRYTQSSIKQRFRPV